MPLALVCAMALIVLPFDFRQALVNSKIGVVMALSLVVITGFVGQISVVQLSLAGVTGFVISRLATDHGRPRSRGRRSPGSSAAVVLGLRDGRLGAARARRQPRDRDARRRRGDLATSTSTTRRSAPGRSGSPVPNLTSSDSNLGPSSAFRGLDGNIPSPVFGWVALVIALLLCLMVGYMRRGGIGQRMLAVRSNERASAAAAVNPRNVKLIAFGISALHRRHRRQPLRLQLRLGQPRPASTRSRRSA